MSKVSNVLAYFGGAISLGVIIGLGDPETDMREAETFHRDVVRYESAERYPKRDMMLPRSTWESTDRSVIEFPEPIKKPVIQVPDPEPPMPVPAPGPSPFPDSGDQEPEPERPNENKVKIPSLDDLGILYHDRSPNHYNGRGGKDIDLIVIHTTGSTFGSTRNTFTNRAEERSAHYVIKPDGTIYQFVDLEDAAWHCKGSNQRSVGIENVGYPTKQLTDKQIDANVRLIRALQGKYNITDINVKPHSALDAKPDPGEANYMAIMRGLESDGIYDTIKK